jgi:alkanesulfonate monooxygenase SsuD/methylene tetrahydromethanopterin reductase-like flavin-dependent oxidoreductase (luciferase family)
MLVERFGEVTMNTQPYVAGVTSHAAVGTAAVILPWNDPLRVAEKISLLDHLTAGRLRFGIGRGLSRREFAAFNKIGMEESRERFDESASMILEALRTGFIEGAREILSPAADRDPAETRAPF